ncbi:hypothetical protein L9F63_025595, partial [Diploptera punctata]
ILAYPIKHELQGINIKLQEPVMDVLVPLINTITKNVKVEIKSEGDQTNYVAIEHGIFPAPSKTKVKVKSVAVRNDIEKIVTKEEVTENLVPEFRIKQIQGINIKHLLPVMDVLVPVMKTITK